MTKTPATPVTATWTIVGLDGYPDETAIGDVVAAGKTYADVKWRESGRVQRIRYRDPRGVEFQTLDDLHAKALIEADRRRHHDWYEMCYRRAVEINAACPHVGEASQILIDEAHADAIADEIDRVSRMVDTSDRPRAAQRFSPPQVAIRGAKRYYLDGDHEHALHLAGVAERLWRVRLDAAHEEALAENQARTAAADRVHFDPQFGTPPPCGDAEPWDTKTTNRDEVTCHMCAAHLDSRAVLRPLGAVAFTASSTSRRPDPGANGEYVHLMIRDFHPPRGLRGTAEFACNQDGSRNGMKVPMTNRTADASKVTCPDCLATTRPAAPERTDDDARWSAYSAALPTPDVAEYAKVVAEFCTSPYAAGRQRALDGFRRVARMIWRWRHTAAAVDRFAYRVARAELHGFAARIRAYDALTQHWITEQAERMRSEAEAMTSPKVGA